MNKLLTGMVVLAIVGLFVLAGCARQQAPASPAAPTGMSGDVSSIDNDLATLDDDTGSIDTAELDTVDEAVG